MFARRQCCAVVTALALGAIVGCRPAAVVAPVEVEAPIGRDAAAPEPAVATVKPEPSAPEPTPPDPTPAVSTLVQGPAAPAPASVTQREVLFASPEDPEPEIRGGIVKALEDVSYIVGNEWALDAFLPAIADKGGGYIGVGPDQAYLFIGWQKPEFAWLIDYDTKVMRVHAMYRAVFEIAQTRKQFLDAFEHAHADRISKVLAVHDDARLRRMYRNNRDMFRWRLRTVEKHLKKRGVASWLTDDEMYTFVRDMVLGDRVRPLRVNLNEANGMAGIADAAQKLGVAIRVVYLSNAEEYWDTYAEQFERNIAALPHDEQSLLLRTRLVWHVNRDYIYNAQPLDNFLQWLALPQTRTLEDIVGEKPKAEKGRVNFVMTTQAPPPALELVES